MNTDIIQITTAPAGSVSLTKRSQKELSDKLVAFVEEGEVNALDSLVKLTWLKDAIEDALKGIRPLALTEAEKYGQKQFGAFGADINIRETAVKYDFSDDNEWCVINDQLNELKAMQKGREEMLKRMKLCAKQSTTAVAITLRRE